MADTFISSFDGTQIYFNKELVDNSKAAVVIVHGLCEHQGRYDYFADALHAAGYSTYRFDHRGHGKSEGEFPHLTSFQELIDDTKVVVDIALEENPDTPVFVYGHSMGGFTVALFGATYPDMRLAGIICNGGLTADKQGIIGTVPSGLSVLDTIPNELGDGVCSVQEVRDWYLKDPLNTNKYSFGLVYALQDGLAWFNEHRKDFSYPVFITHGELDALVSQEDSRIMFDTIASQDKQLKIYGNLFHETINEYCRDEVISDYIAWMDRRI